MRSLEIASSGMLAQQTNVDVISNNIANMTTTGFKRQRVDFKDLMYQNIQRPGATTSDQDTRLPSGIQLGLGVRVGAVYRLNEQGALSVTDNNMDLALSGDGFFQVQMPDGSTGYTRAGVMQLNQNGEIVTNEGYRLSPTITVPTNASNFAVDPTGQVSVTIPGQTNAQVLGQIQLARFVNPTGLQAIGDNLLLETEASGTPTTGTANADGFAAIRQGSIEGSNVNVVDEITSLIGAQRAYEMNSNVISTSNQMLQTISQLKN